MSDAVEPQPLAVPQVTELALLARLQKLREWQDQQVEQLRYTQRQQWQQLQQEQEKVCQLLGKKKDGSSTVAKNNCLKPSENINRALLNEDFSDKSAYEKTRYDDQLDEIKMSSAESDEAPSEDDGIYPLSETTSEEEQPNTEKKSHQVELRLAVNHFDDNRPIQPGISGGVKSFDDLLKEHLSHQGKEAVLNDAHSMIHPKKKPFLKKGAGLARFNFKPKVPNIKKKTCDTTSEKTKSRKPAYAIPVLKLKPQINSKPEVPEMPVAVNIENENPVSNLRMPPKESGKILKNAEDSIPSVVFDDSFMKNEDLDSKKEKELQELAEFEMLESAAQNSSFTSDSSIFLQALHNHHLQSSPVVKICGKSKKGLLCQTSYDVKNSESGNIFGKGNEMQDMRLPEISEMRKLLEAVSHRKKILEEKVVQLQIPKEPLSDIEGVTELNSSENIYSDEDTLIEESTHENRASVKDVLQKILEKRMPFCVSTHSDVEQSDMEKKEEKVNETDKFQFDDELSWQSNAPSGNSSPHGYNKVSTGKSFDEADTSLLESSTHESPQTKDYGIQVSTHGCSGADCGVVDRLELKQKLQELEDEIQIFKKENEALKILQKQREEALQQLLKEKKEFEKYKEEETKRMELELTEEKKQLKRQKLTYERCQKMKQNTSDKKEREDMASLKHQVQQLQEEMKKQELTFGSELRRLKNTLNNVEKDRDRLKGEVQYLETIRLELLTALKEKQTSRPQAKKTVLPKKPQETSELPPHNVVKEVEKERKHCKVLINSKKQDLYENKLQKTVPVFISDSLDTIETSICSLNVESEMRNDNNDNDEQPKQKHRVRFNLEPEYEKDDDISTDNEYEEVHHKDKIERVYRNGEREIIYPSGTRKHFGVDSSSITVYFYNGDVKEVFPDQRVVYRYAEDDIIQTTYPDGLVVVEFSNGQIERSHPDGTKHISFSDGSHRIIYSDGSEENQVKDGTIIKIATDGTETVQYPNGETEIRTKEYKRRQFADGTIKTVYTSGRQETRYNNGRIRIKDKDGHVVVDTKYLVQQLQAS